MSERVLKNKGRTNGGRKSIDRDWGSYSEDGVLGSGNSAQDLDWNSYADNNV